MSEVSVIQLSDEWFKLRLGKLTASKYPKLMPTPRQKPGAWSETQVAILLETASERLTGQREETFTNKAMQWGNDTEAEARAFYGLTNMVTVRESGFFETSEFTGGSPDGIIVKVEDCGCLEIKCPNSKQHLKYLLDVEQLKKSYKWQALGHIFNTGLGYCDLVSFDPRFKDDNKKMVSCRFTAEDYADDLLLLQNRINEAVELIKEWVS